MTFLTDIGLVIASCTSSFITCVAFGGAPPAMITATIMLFHAAGLVGVEGICAALYKSDSMGGVFFVRMLECVWSTAVFSALVQINNPQASLRTCVALGAWLASALMLFHWITTRTHTLTEVNWVALGSVMACLGMASSFLTLE